MQKFNLNTLKRDCFIALAIPVVTLIIYQYSSKTGSTSFAFILSTLSTIILGATVYRFFNRLEDMTWKHQLNCVIQKVSAPVLIVDTQYNIAFANDNFYRLPLATLLSRFNNLPELLSIQIESLSYDQRLKHLSNIKETLDGLSGRMKNQLFWAGDKYELVIIPLCSPTGKRWGTMVECRLKEYSQVNDNDAIPLTQIIEQLSVPFLFVDTNDKITYLNASLRSLMIKHQIIIERLVPQLNVYDTSNITLNHIISLSGNEGVSFYDLSTAENVIVDFDEESYELTLQPLFDDRKELLGNLVIWQKINSSSFQNVDGQTTEDIQEVEEQNTTNEHSEFIVQSLQNASCPIVVLDENYHIQHASVTIGQLLHHQYGFDEDDNLLGKSFVELVNGAFPKLTARVLQAFESKNVTTFVTEHYNKVCDWIVSPIKDNKRTIGYVVEVIYPSRQEMLTLEESWERIHHNKVSLEKELAHFTNGLSKLKLYQKGEKQQIPMKEFHHPLLKNSSKIIYELGDNLHKLHSEIDHLKKVFQTPNTAIDENAIAVPLHQVNILSSSIERNVQEVKHDFGALNQELAKLKGLIKEQKGLNLAYNKPVGKAIQSTENALMQTVGYSEIVTMVLQQLHENQSYLAQLQDFMRKLGKLPGNSSLDNSVHIYQEIVSLLDTVKQGLSTSKQKLRDLLLNFEGLKSCWNMALENLKSCLELSVNVDQATSRWSSVTNEAHKYSQHVQQRLQSLIDLTQKIQTKTHAIDVHGGSSLFESQHRRFEQMVMEVDETKKKAEDVLLEEIRRK